METSARQEGEFQNLLMYDYCHKHQQEYNLREKMKKKTNNQNKMTKKNTKKKKKSKKPEVQVVPFKKVESKMKSPPGQASPAEEGRGDAGLGAFTELDPLGAACGHRCCCLRREESAESRAAPPGRQLPSANSPKDHRHERWDGAGCPRGLLLQSLINLTPLPRV